MTGGGLEPAGTFFESGMVFALADTFSYAGRNAYRKLQVIIYRRNRDLGNIVANENCCKLFFLSFVSCLLSAACCLDW